MGRSFGRGLVAVFAALLLAQADAATAIFKFRDADGVWHYSDKRPSAEQPVELLELFGSAPEQQRTVFVEKRGSPTQPQLFLVNKNRAPVEVKFWYTQTDNVRTQPVPERLTVPGLGETRVANLFALNASLPMHLNYQIQWQLGDPAAIPDAGFVYAAPVPAEGAFPITQAFNGTHSHNTEGSRYAIDIGMPIGSAVRAARGGEVISVQDSNAGGGDSVAYRSQTNSLYILHDDGTFGVYAHLRQHSALVQPGQRVRSGQILAQSGNTGYSSGPHLHFAVLRNAGLHWTSLPFILATGSGAVKPTQGLALSAATLPERVASRDR